MKIRTLLVMTTAFACLAQGQAQRREVSERYSVPVDIPMTGTLTYHVIPDGKGENVKDGPLSIRASQKPISAVVNFERLTISGSYSLDANYRNGQLNGKFSVSTTMNSKSYRSNQTATYTMNGNFLNGKPNGNFTARYKSPNAELNVNYKNGKLVGSYYLKSFVSGYGNRNYKGTLTANGDLTGKWEIEKGTKKETEYHTFINNVRVDYYDNESSTPKDIIEKSKLFAQGKISEKELFEQGYMVFEDEIPLGDYASDVILRSDVVEFRKLGGYDFSDDLTHKYKYLKKIAYLSDAGFNGFIVWIKGNMEDPDFSSYDFSHQYGYMFNQTNTKKSVSKYLGIDDNGHYYVSTEGFGCSTLPDKALCRSLYYCERTFLSPKQVENISDSIDKFRRKFAIDFIGYLKLNEYDYNHKFLKLDESTIKMMGYPKISELEEDLRKIRFDTLEKTADKQFYILRYYDDTYYLKDNAIEELKTQINKVHKLKEQYLEEHSMNLIGYLKMNNYNYQLYFSNIEKIGTGKLSYEELSQLEKNLNSINLNQLSMTSDSLYYYFTDEYKHVYFIKSSATKELQDYQQSIQESKKGMLVRLLSKTYGNTIEVDIENSYMNRPDIFKILNNLHFLIGQSGTSIAFDTESPKRFCIEGMPDQTYWQLDLNKAVKKLTKITHIKITGIDGNTVHCEFTRKKKFIYQIDIEFKDGKIMATSLDFEKATILQKL